MLPGTKLITLACSGCADTLAVDVAAALVDAASLLLLLDYCWQAANKSTAGMIAMSFELMRFMEKDLVDSES